MRVITVSSNMLSGWCGWIRWQSWRHLEGRAGCPPTKGTGSGGAVTALLKGSLIRVLSDACLPPGDIARMASQCWSTPDSGHCSR